MSSRPRIVIVGAAPWLAQGLASVLADEARWQLAVRPTIEPADAYVLHARDEEEASELHAALPPLAPVLWVGFANDEREPERGPGREPGGPPRAIGQLPTDAPGEQLRAALAAVLAGLSVRGPAAPWPARAEAPARGAPRALFAGTAEMAETAEALTSRELEVFELLAKGLSNRDIAGVLGISAHTAKFHVAQILAKVAAATRAEAVAIGLRLGLIGL
ncbi:MAG: helix-turn-helix transcriptional regulator [Burkholderiales bacterium]|nr:helix-turn-helix transcriptional regulator [Burkholderiales bacterium]